MKKQLALAFIAAVHLVAPVYAQNLKAYPEKPIRVIVPFAPGGPTDSLSRRVFEPLAARLGQPFILDFKPGGNSMIGTEQAARSASDGYTLISTNTAIIQSPMIYSSASYDEAKDFIPVIQLITTPLILVVRSNLPVKSLSDLLAYVKERPNTTSYGTSGAGGTQHIFSENLKRTQKIDSVFIPYKGEAPLITDFLGGRLDWYIATPSSILPHMKTGKVRALAVTGPDRLELLPDTPTFKELGMSGFDVTGFYGIFAPAKTPKAIVEKLNKELMAIVAQPDVATYFKDIGFTPLGDSAEEFAKRLPYFRHTFQQLIKDNNIKLE